MGISWRAPGPPAHPQEEISCLPTPPPSSRKRWLGLALIATAQFVVIMDTSIIGVALPDIQADLGFTPE
ncbi:hypothetical protein [Sanguibacter inulinus]|uniref:hypothetical protein n=1 Tax=Sanguibacter inulinus TaxID=60922 RepID=UPI001C54D44C|nr:hypothetical protein [Sanguibacter inulinus]